MAQSGQREPASEAESVRAAFGFRNVEPAEKPALVGAVFAAVAPRYDLMNDLMSAGIHRWWKRALVEELAPRPGSRLLDLAGGTGDVALRILDRYQAEREVSVVVCDPSPEMLEVGRTRAWNRGRLAGVAWLCAAGEALPFRDRSFAACTVGFGIRNFTSIERGLAELKRVLVPGGRLLCLEFTPRVLPALQPAYDLFSFRVIPALGGLVAGDRDAYRYLVESIRRFPPPEAFAEMVRAAGFAGVRIRRFAGGVAAMHSAWRV